MDRVEAKVQAMYKVYDIASYKDDLYLDDSYITLENL